MGECFTPSSPNVSFPIWVEYPTIEYFNVPSDSTNASLPYLSNELAYKLLILVSTFNSLPRLVTTIDVLSSSYSIPPFKIITSVIFPFSTTALNLAPIPVPIPTTSKSGALV